jgi:hypothetical protein
MTIIFGVRKKSNSHRGGGLVVTAFRLNSPLCVSAILVIGSKLQLKRGPGSKLPIDPGA